MQNYVLSIKIKVLFLMHKCKDIGIIASKCKTQRIYFLACGGLSDRLFQQIERIQCRPPAQSNTTAVMTVVMHQRHLTALYMQIFPLHPRVRPARPQSHPLALHLSHSQGRFQPDAALQDPLAVLFIHLHPPVTHLPCATNVDVPDARVDVGLAISISYEVLQPRSFKRQHLSSNWIDLLILHQKV